jgi:hypothetical protein
MLKKERTSITTVRELFRTLATFQTRLLSHWSLPLTAITGKKKNGQLGPVILTKFLSFDV